MCKYKYETLVFNFVYFIDREEQCIQDISMVRKRELKREFW